MVRGRSERRRPPNHGTLTEHKYKIWNGQWSFQFNIDRDSDNFNHGKFSIKTNIIQFKFQK